MENSQQDEQAKYIDNAMRAVREKKPLPEIDFTLHTMEDGTQVSTQERVCKGMFEASSAHLLPRSFVCPSAAILAALRQQLQLTPPS